MRSRTHAHLRPRRELCTINICIFMRIINPLPRLSLLPRCQRERVPHLTFIVADACAATISEYICPTHTVTLYSRSLTQSAYIHPRVHLRTCMSCPSLATSDFSLAYRNLTVSFFLYIHIYAVHSLSLCVQRLSLCVPLF